MGILERMRLDGKKAFVTGGARGIGKAYATALAEAGADVAIVDLDLETAERTAGDIAALGVTCFALQADVTDPLQVDAMMAQFLARMGAVHIAFCNAGISINTPAEAMTIDEWNAVTGVNLTGVFLTAQAAGKAMIRQGTGGAIVATASMSGHIVNVPQPQCAYNATKAGVIQLVKSLAVEWAAHNIRVNSISPGYIATEMTARPEVQPMLGKWIAMSPLGRLGTPEELQAAAVYLAGDASHFTTGADIVIDGAFTCI